MVGAPPPTPPAPRGNIDPDKLSRVIMLIYGRTQAGNPFWCYAAIKPSQFEAFKAAEEAGKIDLYNFEQFGEVIVSAEGKTPPPDVTAKVAEMYKVDPATFFRPIDPMLEVEKRVEEFKAKDEKK